MRYFEINVYSTKIRCIFFFLTKYFLISVQIVLAKSFKVKKWYIYTRDWLSLKNVVVFLGAKNKLSIPTKTP